MFRKILLLLVVVVGFLVLVLIYNQQVNRKEISQATRISIRKDLQELSVEEFKLRKKVLIDILNSEDPRKALERLRIDMKNDDAVIRSCHAFAHEIGRASYEKYDDFGMAIQFRDEICNSGYLHGVIENHFKDSKDIVATLSSVCSRYLPEKFIGWECYHGVGHGVMFFTDNDLSQSLSLCETYENSGARFACINGIYMENFNTDQKVHVSKYLRSNDPFYPCGEQKNEYKNDCYMYAPSYYLALNKNKYREAMLWCGKAEKNYVPQCIFGVGVQAMRENIQDPFFVESICTSGSNTERASCIKGMTVLYVNHYGGLGEAQRLCSELQMNNRIICEDQLVSMSDLFTRE